MRVERDIPLLINQFIHQDLFPTYGPMRLETQKSRYGCVFWANNQEFRKIGQFLYEYISRGTETDKGIQGRSIFAEYIVAELLSDIFGSTVRHAPLVMDASTATSRGCDLIIAQQTKNWVNGRYVEEGILGIDVTTASDLESVRKKRKRANRQAETEMPVVVLAVARIPGFIVLLDTLRQNIKTGDFPRQLIANELPSYFFQKIFDNLVFEIRRRLSAPSYRQRLGLLFSLAKQSHLLDFRNTAIALPSDILKLIKEYEETPVNPWMF